MTTRVGQSYSYNVLCDRCGWKKKSHEVKVDWQGFVVCKDCYEPRHPLDFFRTRSDTHQLPFIRSDNNGVDVSPDYTIPAASFFCTPTTQQPVLGVGTFGCFTFTS